MDVLEILGRNKARLLTEPAEEIYRAILSIQQAL
jgi:hypothetical protein